MANECSNIGPIKDCCGNVQVDIGNDSEVFAGVIWRLAVAIVLSGQLMMFGLGINITPPVIGSGTYITLHSLLILFTAMVLVLLGKSLFQEAWKNLRKRRISLEGLFAVSSLGALAGSLISTITGKGQVYYEVVAIVLVIYTIGKLLSVRSRKKVIEESSKIRDSFDYAYVMKDGERKQVRLEDVHCCCEVVVGPGDAVTVDGVITAGEGFIHETAMTGELEPTTKRIGDYILAGSYSVDGVFTIKPTALKGVRRLDSLLRAVEEARLAPSVLQEQADKVVQWFLPLVITVSIGTFLFWLGRGTLVNALFNSMAVLLVACPCALGLATPIAVWSGLWKLSTMGLISRSGELLDALARGNRIIFDKTGTLSEEELSLVGFEVAPKMKDRVEWLKGLIFVVESQIDHPIARALAKLKGNGNHIFTLVYSRIIPGKGIEAELSETKDGELKIYTMHIGELELMPRADLFEWEGLDRKHSKKMVYISVNGVPAAVVSLDEKMREGLDLVFSELKKLNIKGMILTGDTSRRYELIEGVEVIAGLSPNDKESQVKALEEAGERTIFIGDGVNDAAAMTMSSASIAMGGGAALTQSTASGILMGQTLEVLPKAVKLCRKIRRTARANMIYAATYNCVGMSLAATGILHPVVAALLMLVSSVFVSIRASKAVKL
jgi:Cu+-exporting ATPase